MVFSENITVPDQSALFASCLCYPPKPIPISSVEHCRAVKVYQSYWLGLKHFGLSTHDWLMRVMRVGFRGSTIKIIGWGLHSFGWRNGRHPFVSVANQFNIPFTWHAVKYISWRALVLIFLQFQIIFLAEFSTQDHPLSPKSSWINLNLPCSTFDASISYNRALKIQSRSRYFFSKWVFFTTWDFSLNHGFLS